jgi:transposase
MTFDFTTAPPKPSDLDTAHQLIADLRAFGLSSTTEYAALKEKRNTHPTNSSLPPSMAVFGKHKKNIQSHQRKTDKKQGAQAGHVGKGRKLLSNEDVQSTIACLPKTTCACGGHVKARPDRFKRHPVFELPKIEPIVTEYQRRYGTCRQCGMQHLAELPYGVSPNILGAGAMSSIAILTGDYKLSKRSVSCLFGDFFNTPISLGTASNAEAVVSEAVKSPVEEAKSYIKTYRSWALDTCFLEGMTC